MREGLRKKQGEEGHLLSFLPIYEAYNDFL